MRYAIALDTALRLMRERVEVPAATRLVAPTLLRSQALSHLYASVRRGDIDRKSALSQLDHMRALNIRLLGDRVLQKVALDIAGELGWEDSFTAEYVALARLQADAFVTLDDANARSVRGMVRLASFEDLLAEQEA